MKVTNCYLFVLLNGKKVFVVLLVINIDYFLDIKMKIFLFDFPWEFFEEIKLVEKKVNK